MAKGRIFSLTFSDYVDPISDKRVIQLTPKDQFNHLPYFYNKCITNDNNHLIYGNKTKDQRNLFKMNLENATSLQLTESDGINEFTAVLNSNDRFLIYVKNRQIIRLFLNDLEEEIIYEIPDGWSITEMISPSLSSDDKYLAFEELKTSEFFESKGNLTVFVKQWNAMPFSRIVVVDIERKSSEIVHEEQYWIGQVQFRPGDNDTLYFCHEGPWQLVDARIWLVNRNGTNLRCAKPRVGIEQFGHEFWLKDGSKIGFIHFPRFYGRDGTIRFIDPDTLDEEILMDCSGYSHCISNNNSSKLVGDGFGATNPYIYLVDITKKEEEVLCEHRSSYKPHGHTQDSHPHPNFSQDGSFVVFTSDKTATPAIYKVFV